MFWKKIKNAVCPVKHILRVPVGLFIVALVCADAGAAQNNDRLIQAAEKGLLQDVQTALAQGADTNAKSVKKYYNIFGKEITPLIAASENGHAEIVKLLLQKGADPNFQRLPERTTALMLAAENGHADVMKILLEGKADINAINNTGITALMRPRKTAIRMRSVF